MIKIREDSRHPIPLGRKRITWVENGKIVGGYRFYREDMSGYSEMLKNLLILMKKNRADVPGNSRREKIVSLLRERDNNLCGICGNELYGAVEIDHIIPQCEKIDHRAENIRLTHEKCHLHRKRKTVSSRVRFFLHY